MTDDKPDDLMSRIDAETSGQGQGQDEEFDRDSLEGRLRLLVPGHTFWEREEGVTGVLAAFARHLGADLDPDKKPGDVVKAVWTCPDGAWMIGFQSCRQSRHQTYRVTIDGPETDVNRSDLTADQAIDLLRAVGAIGR